MERAAARKRRLKLTLDVTYFKNLDECLPRSFYFEVELRQMIYPFELKVEKTPPKKKKLNLYTLERL